MFGVVLRRIPVRVSGPSFQFLRLMHVIVLHSINSTTAIDYEVRVMSDSRICVEDMFVAL